MEMRKQFIWGTVLAASVLVAIAVTQRNGIVFPTMDRKEFRAQASMAVEHNSLSGESSLAKSEASPGMGGGGVGGGMGLRTASAPEESAKLTLASMSDSQVDRYLIKNAVVLIEAKDVVQAASQAKEFAKSISGYV